VLPKAREKVRGGRQKGVIHFRKALSKIGKKIRKKVDATKGAKLRREELSESLISSADALGSSKSREELGRKPARSR